MKDMSFSITDENGKTMSFDVLYTFSHNNEDYMIYTDNELDEDGNIEVLATKYVKDNDKITFIPIDKDEEWELVDKKWSELDD